MDKCNFCDFHKAYFGFLLLLKLASKKIGTIWSSKVKRYLPSVWVRLAFEVVPGSREPPKTLALIEGNLVHRADTLTLGVSRNWGTSCLTVGRHCTQRTLDICNISHASIMAGDHEFRLEAAISGCTAAGRWQWATYSVVKTRDPNRR